MSESFKEVASTGAELFVIECVKCAFHLGLDHSYLEQVGPIRINCPSCGKLHRVDYEELSA